MKNDKTWVVVYKKVYKTPEGEYLSAYVHTFPEISLKYEIGKVTKAKVGAMFCLPNLKAAHDCPEGNATLKVLACEEVKGPDNGAVGSLASTLQQIRQFWLPRRKGNFSTTYSTVFYKKVLPVEVIETNRRA